MTDDRMYIRFVHDYIGFNIGDDTVNRNPYLSSLIVTRQTLSNLPTRDTIYKSRNRAGGRVVSLVWQAGHWRSQSLTDPPSRL